MHSLWHRIFKLWEQYEHHLGVGALLLGFVFDLWAAKRPDSAFNNILLLTYLCVAGAFIIVLNLRARRRKDDATPLFLLLVLQFCFGGLASNMLVLYGHSGTLAGSAVFIAILVLVVFGNEYFRSRYSALRFNIGVYYFLLLSYLLVAVPIYLTHRIGIITFLLSGILSLLLMAGFLAALFFLVFRGTDVKKLVDVSLIVGAIFCIFNLFYFLNIIPPVPLSLKDIGVYHSVLRRADNTYLALYEQPAWYAFWRDTNSTYTLPASGTAYCFSSVFAPADLQTPIIHTWEYHTASGEWSEQSRVSFPISGGRADGYRGYSIKVGLEPGQWRCNVETASGALIGRIGFTAVAGPAGSSTLQLSQKTL